MAGAGLLPFANCIMAPVGADRCPHVRLLSRPPLSSLAVGYNSRMPPPITFQEYYRAFAAALDGRARLTRLPNGALTALIGRGGRRLAVLAGLHGDEIGGPLGLLDWVAQSKALLPPGVSLWLLPLANDLGWDAGEREWQGLDLNRAFLPGRRAPAMLRPVMASWRRRPPDLFLDFHEDLECQGPAYIFRYTEEQHDLPEKMAAALNAPMLDWTEFAEWEGCSELFLRSLGCDRCVTLETPAGWSLEQRRRWVCQVLDWSLQYLRDYP